MKKKVLSLSSEGRLVLKGSDGKAEDIPRSCNAFAYLVIDCSASMSGDKLAQAKKGSRDFAEDAIKKGYFIGLIRFDSTAKLLCEPITDIWTLSRHVEELLTGSSTNMADGIQLAIESLSLRDGIRSMVVVTDGMPDDSKADLAASQRAKERGIDIITIGTDDADKEFLSKLASRADLSIKVSRDRLGESIATAAKMLPGTSE